MLDEKLPASVGQAETSGCASNQADPTQSTEPKAEKQVTAWVPRGVQRLRPLGKGDAVAHAGVHLLARKWRLRVPQHFQQGPYHKAPPALVGRVRRFGPDPP